MNQPYVRPRQLGLVHLLVWVGACAVQAALVREYWHARFEKVPVPLLFCIESILIGGTDLAGLFLLANRRLARRNLRAALLALLRRAMVGGGNFRRLFRSAMKRFWRQEFPTEPGEWLWVAGSVSWLYWLGAPWLEPFPYGLLLFTTTLIGGTLVAVYGAVRIRESGPWRLGLVLIGTEYLLRACSVVLPFYLSGFLRTVFLSFRRVFGWGPNVLVSLLSVSDVLEKRKRSWEHWVGIGLRLCAILTWLLYHVL